MSNELINNFCMGCMREKNTENKCTFCGFEEGVYTVSPHHLPLRTILGGKYLVGRVLGEGGFGITYLGWDLNLDIKIAIKEYYPNGFVTRENTSTNTVTPYVGEKEQFFTKGRARFVDEAKSLAKFYALPGIVSVKDFFLENGTAYIVMEFVEGETLKQLLTRSGGNQPADQVFEMMKPLMRSLSEIHKAGIIHRDISPDNMMVTPEGNVKLIDFGAARSFEDSGNKSLSVMLKPGYAPEEQYRSRGIQGPWTDVYALCTTIYRAITGVTPMESIERVQKDDVKKPSELGISIQPQQETALMKGMAVLQSDRYKNVEDLSAALYADATEPLHMTVTESLQQSTPEAQNQIEHELKQERGWKKAVKHIKNLFETPESKGKKKRLIIIFASAGAFVVLAVCFIVFFVPQLRYNWAVSEMTNGSYDNAIIVFKDLGNYKDAQYKVFEAEFDKADALYNAGECDEAIDIYSLLINSSTDTSQKNRAMYSEADSLLKKEDYKGAETIFEELGSYKDSADMATKCVYQYALMLEGMGKYEDAEAIFKGLGDYQDSASMVTKCVYQYALMLEDTGKYEEAYNQYISLGDYEDAVSHSESCCLAQLKIVLEDETTDTSVRDEWISRCLKNKDLTDEAHKEIGTVIEDKITGGSDDYAYSLIMNDLKDYPDKYTEQGYNLASDYISKNDYEKGQDILTWISEENYKDTAALLLECRYQLVLQLVAKDPTDTSTLTQLYNLAKLNYKDSRNIMNSICTPKFLMEFMSYSTPSFSQSDTRTWLHIYTGTVAFYEYKYSFSMKINISSPIPIKGKLQMKCTASYSVSPTNSSTTKKKTYTFTCTINPKSSTATISGTTTWLRGSPCFVSLTSVSGKNALHVYYED